MSYGCHFSGLHVRLIFMFVQAWTSLFAWASINCLAVFHIIVQRKRDFCRPAAWSTRAFMEPPPRTTTAAAVVYALVAICVASAVAAGGGEQPLSKIAIHRATVAPQPGAFIDASPALLGLGVSLLELKRLWSYLTASSPPPPP